MQTQPQYIATCTNKQCQKTKKAFPWILQELDAPPPKISRPYYINEPFIIPLEAVKELPDQRHHKETLEETTRIISELDHILNQELEASTTLSELDHMLETVTSR